MKIVELDTMPKDFLIIDEDLIIRGTGLNYQGAEHHERILSEAK